MRPVAVLFFLNGCVVSSFYARLPAVKDRLDLDAGQVSLALLGLTTGLLVAQPLTGALIGRLGSARACVLGGVTCAAAVAVPALMGSLGALVAACVLLGAANGLLDVAMNVEGAAVEAREGRTILARLHALFSLGMLAAAGSSAIVAGAGVDVRAHLAAVAGVGVLVALAVAPGLRGGAVPAVAGPAFVLPRGGLLIAGAIAFCVLLCEGAIADWSAIHLRESLDQPAGVAALGLAAFSVAMAAGRLAGDAVTARLGETTHVRAGALLGGAGLLLAALAPTGGVAIAAFLAAGLGLSALFPLVVRIASREAAPGPAIAAVSTAGYAGLVTGPPVVGALADATDLRLALATVLGGLCTAAVLLSRSLRTAPPLPR